MDGHTTNQALAKLPSHNNLLKPQISLRVGKPHNLAKQGQHPLLRTMLRHLIQQPLKHHRRNQLTTRARSLNRLWRYANRGKSEQSGLSIMGLILAISLTGIIFGIVIPKLLNDRICAQGYSQQLDDQAEANSKVSETIAAAKKCASFNSEASVVGLSYPIRTPSGESVTCGGQTPTDQSIVSLAWSSPATVDCLGTTYQEATKVTIDISAKGQMDCRLDGIHPPMDKPGERI